MSPRTTTRGPRWPHRCASVVAVSALLLTACAQGGATEGATARALVVAEVVASTSTSSTSSTSSSTTSSSTTTTVSPATTAPPTTAPPSTQPAPPPSTTAPPAPAATGAAGGAYCIGDSVMVGAGPRLFDVLSMCGVVDAVESRQVRNSGGAVSAALASGASTVVVHLGTNGPFTTAQLDAVLAPLGGVPRVVVVTIQTSGRLGHQSAANAELRAAAGRYGNVRIADFEAATNGQAGYFATDGIHLSRSGAQVFASVIAGAVG